MKAWAWWVVGGLSLAASVALAGPEVSKSELAKRGVPVSKAAFAEVEAEAGWELCGVQVEGFEAKLDEPAIVVLTTLRYWFADGGGIQTRRLLSVYRPGKSGAWVRRRHDEVSAVAGASYVSLSLANLDADGDDEIILTHDSGGSAGDNAIEVRDLEGGTWECAVVGGIGQHSVADVDGDGRSEVLGRYRLRETNGQAPCNAARIFRPVVFSYAQGALTEDREGFRPYYERELGKAGAELAKAQRGKPSPLRSYHLVAYAELVQALREELSR